MQRRFMNQDLVELHFFKLMKEGLGFDMNDPNLIDTPKRVAKMFCKELFHAVDNEFPEKDFRKFPNDRKYNQITMIDNIHFTSVCSHHFLPFTGRAWFLYIPNEHDLIGASKMPRIISHYAARPQLQENLCHEVINRFVDVMKPKAAMLVMRAVHGCMSCRGVNQYNNTGMTSSAIYGGFEKPELRAEAMGLINLSTKSL